MDSAELRDILLKKYAKYSQDIMELTKIASKSDIINPKLYEKYDVKRGLRDINGNGVVCGLTEISEIVAFGKDADGNKIPADGELYYRGISIRDLGMLTIGLVNDMYAESSNDGCTYATLATQEDFDRF